MGTRGEVFSSKANTAKRTYFFNVKENRTGDVFLNIVESKKSRMPPGAAARMPPGAAAGEEQFERRSVIVFKEDLAAFLEGFEAALKYIKGR
jgi:glycerol kinase